MLIQIAGVHDQDEAELIIAAGATHIGLPLRLPDGREDLSEPDARLSMARWLLHGRAFERQRFLGKKS